MTYIATVSTFAEAIAAGEFTSLKAAKEWARANVTDHASVVVADASFSTRYIKLSKLNNKSVWTGDAPKSWFNA